MQSYDVVIVGAGISGIGAAYNLQKSCPTKSFTIFEGRENIGGTWDLFKYPGIRSDSDMHTMGFRFKPWTDPKTIADGPSILEYLNEAADENNLREKIQFRPPRPLPGLRVFSNVVGVSMISVSGIRLQMI